MNGNKNDNHPGSAAAVLHRWRHAIAGVVFVVLAWSLAGYVVAPWLLHKQAVEFVRTEYGANLGLDAVRINPWVLSLTIDGLTLDDPAGEPVATANRVFVNMQLSSLFRRALTFAEFRIDAPMLYVMRARSGELNLAFLLDADDAATPSEEGADGLPRILVFDFAINDSVFDWDDRVPEEAVVTRFGPVNVQVRELNTLPQRSGEQSVVITTESSGTLSWTGNLQLNPLLSEGRATISGAHFSLPSRYLQQLTGFSFPAGETEVALSYGVRLDDQGVLRATIEDLDFAFTAVTMRKSDPGEPFTGGLDREVLALPLLRVDDASVHWPERTVRVPAVAVDDAVLHVYRDAGGRTNWLPEATATDGGEASAAPASSGGAAEWDVLVDRIDVRRLALGFEDHSVEPYADVGLESLDLVITGVSNRSGARFPLEATMLTRGGGTVAIAGEAAVLPATEIEWQVTGDGLVLANVHPYLQPLADVNLDSGTLAFSLSVASGPEQPMHLAGDARIDDFLITETDEGSELGSWRQLDLRGLDLDLAERSLAIAEVAFAAAYADIFIAEDGSVNLGRVEKGQQAPPAGNPPAAPPPVRDVQAGAEEQPLAIRIGRVTFTNSGADFADESLPLPFAARIAELGGDISTIASDSRQASAIALEGKVDEHGFVRVSGTVTPLDPALNTDMRVVFENVDMPKFSAYSVPFAGRKIASGRLDLDLGYQVHDRKLAGENGIVLHDFELGEKVEHPGAMSLPLGLAVALLKDPDGTIDVDLPVRGDLDDPEFRYGGVILKALANLIVKIVASPFALLGNLIGVEADEISHVDFIAGRADLTPPERERVAKLVEALKLRPQLALELPGTFNQEIDGLALRQAAVMARVEEQLAAGAGDTAGFAEARTRVLEALYLESEGAADAAALEEVKRQYTVVPDADEDANGAAALDTLAYAAELERRLVAAATVADSELTALADARAAGVRAAVLEIDPALANRVVIGESQGVSEGEEAAIPMAVVLTAGAE
ncbi:MAG TPA: DUF748 domain-containing protein [Woeseiaceae bacterium]|nr:DUF748 domain-containing protein [Woeseiaceae bacterium]